MRYDRDTAFAQAPQRVGDVPRAHVLRDGLDPVDAGHALYGLGDLRPPSDSRTQSLHDGVMAPKRRGEPIGGDVQSNI
ncbi:hypothetical protein GCM10023080_050310 [Streptomyces pseudoechinosporeus]